MNLHSNNTQTDFKKYMAFLSIDGENINPNKKIFLNTHNEGAINKSNNLLSFLQDTGFIVASKGIKYYDHEHRSKLWFAEHVEKIIKKNGVERIETFYQYKTGWNYGSGNTMSIASFDNLVDFLELFSDMPTVPNVFMTDNGNLEILWEDAKNNDVNIEFFPNKYEYYLETIGEEGKIELNQVENLIKKLRSN